ncbi:Cobalt-precorrin-6y C15-methyltransferase [decarboxylating] [Vagococcus fluvialis bH819]|uniref:Cobalt-precorrin-6y C15-methyltransferase [decarboxylating] n=2 Tax=Enterococcaceae TaxID=81852 RepID=A0A1X6WPN6_9ENTE|nr:Cobalt-precorrin-6y C15-methyltransferase [decarboxylating] [Vagococcus fluvialis bH819]
MTKEEIRTISLAKLNLKHAKRFLDVGAGTGSISIEACVEYPNLEVTAIETKDVAVDLILENKEKFGVENLEVIQGKAPIELEKKFDSIFVGGSGGNLEDILNWSFEHLNPGGSLVLNFILLENATVAFKWLEEQNMAYDTVQIQVGNGTKLGSGHYFKPLNPVIIIETKKEGK